MVCYGGYVCKIKSFWSLFRAKSCKQTDGSCLLEYLCLRSGVPDFEEIIA